jgi:hypothetical protein
LDYPAAGGCPSLLVEPAATNLLPENLTVANWVVAPNATAADSGIASPVSGFNWGLVTANVGTFASVQPIYSGATLSLDITKIYYQTAFLKEGTSRYIGVRTGGANYTEVIDFQTKTIYRTAGNVTNKVASRLIDKGDYLEFQTEAKTTTTYAPFRVYLLKDPDVTIGADGIPAAETFDGTETFYAQGAQFEVDRRTSLINAGAAATTRNADVISKTGVSGFIGQTEGTIYVEIDFDGLYRSTRIFNRISSSDGSLDFAIRSTVDGTAQKFHIRVATSLGTNYNLFNNIDLQLGTNKIALKYTISTDLSGELFVNGQTQGTNNGLKFADDLENVFLSPDFSAIVYNGRIRAAAIYTTRLEDDELIALTTL